MNKVVDIERLKNKYLHRVGAQFDNAIFVAEKEFLINAYTKDDMVAMLEELKSELEKYEPKWIENDEQAAASCRTWEDFDEIIQNKINTLEGEDNDNQRN